MERFEGKRKPRVLIVGGGVAALEALLGLRRLAEERVEIELVAPERAFVYKPLAISELFGVGDVRRFDLAAIVADQGATYTPDAITSVDSERRIAHTRANGEIPYDALVVACGARMRHSLDGAVTFWGAGDGGAIEELLADIEAGRASEVAFALPSGPSWPLPLYELALLTSAHLADAGVDSASLSLVTPEEAPLAIFGARASAAIRALLSDRGIAVLTGAHPAEIEEGHLRLVPAGRIAADRVVTVPRTLGPAMAGLPEDEHGYIPVDRHGRVRGVAGVFAAGDAVAFPIKQGGLAAQQADAVAEVLAAWSGADVTPKPFDPVLRGLLLTGGEARFLRSEIGGGRGESSVATSQALWWPPGKIAGRHLAPYLAALAGADLDRDPPEDRDGIQLEVSLEQEPA